jgi:hypothetical protein
MVDSIETPQGDQVDLAAEATATISNKANIEVIS